MTAYSAPVPSKLVAMLLMLAASALVAATTLIAKALGTPTLGPPLHPLQITHGRFIFALLAISTAFAILRPGLGKVHWGLHVSRTTCGATGVTLMFAAAALIPLSDATAISFLNPVFAMIFAIPLLGERVGRIRWSAAVIALLGAFILLRPGSGTMELGGLLALGAAVVLGLEIIIIKRLSGREKPLQVLLINNIIGTCLLSAVVVSAWIAPTGTQWAALAALGFCMAGAQAFFVNAMARAEASFVVPFSYATLVFATVYDAAAFSTLPDTLSFLGAGVILAGALLLAWREARLQAAKV